MARLGRYFLPDQPLHVIQRGNNRQKIFFSDADRETYLAWLLVKSTLTPITNLTDAQRAALQRELSAASRLLDRAQDYLR